ncbi:MAG: SpoIID/LytB domain-containing protein [Terracidiphilus sp.]
MRPFLRALVSVLRLAVVSAAIVAPAVAQSSSAKASSHPAATLRIGLWTLWHDREVTVAPGPGGAASLRTCEVCAALPLAQPTPIRAAGNRLVLANNRDAAAAWLAGPVTLAAHGERLTIANPVRITARNGELILAVTLPVESYVERVVVSESGSADSAESLKALAVVVRSFALHQYHRHADYDLCDSTHCQLLHWGETGERRAAAHAATLATSGQTLWFHGQPAAAWFHQNCGGRTASPQEVWPQLGPSRKPMPWLASRVDNFCTAGGARQWSANLSLAELTSALAAAGLARPGWKNLTVERRGASGRAVTLRADSAAINAEEFRLAVGRALGWNRILSTWFEVTRQGDRFIFNGRGSGHGVGLCQAGAAAMAANGRDSNEILAQYFPGATAVDEGTGMSWQNLHGQGFQLETLDPADAAYLPELNRALAEAENRSGLSFPGPVTVRAFRTTSAFRDATLAPGWVAAFTERDWIGTQPLRTLAARKLLVPILRHEFLHALVESQATAKATLWLREGLVEAWSEDIKATGPAPTLKLDEIDRGLANAFSEAQSEAAHRAAGWYAARLLSKFGRGQLLGWLRSGIPAGALAASL